MTVSAAAATVTIPAVITPESLIGISEADGSHRYELTPEGVLEVMPPSGFDHTDIQREVLRWLLARFEWAYQEPAVFIGLGNCTRVPDVALFLDRPQQAGNLATPVGLHLVVEVLSKSTRKIDLGDKISEYARVGIPHYWTVERVGGRMVTMRRLLDSGAYGAGTKQPLAWALNQDPRTLLSLGEAR